MFTLCSLEVIVIKHHLLLVCVISSILFLIVKAMLMPFVNLGRPSASDVLVS